jgi:hypothetical protein
MEYQQKINFIDNVKLTQKINDRKVKNKKNKNRFFYSCKHNNIIQDSIDIGFEKCKTIFYCESCEKTFQNKLPIKLI